MATAGSCVHVVEEEAGCDLAWEAGCVHELVVGYDLAVHVVDFCHAVLGGCDLVMVVDCDLVVVEDCDLAVVALGFCPLVVVDSCHVVEVGCDLALVADSYHAAVVGCDLGDPVMDGEEELICCVIQDCDLAVGVDCDLALQGFDLGVGCVLWVEFCPGAGYDLAGVVYDLWGWDCLAVAELGAETWGADCGL